MNPTSLARLAAPALLVTAVASAQVPVIEKAEPARRPLIFEDGEHELATLVDRVAAFLDRNYLVEANVFQVPDPKVVLHNPLVLNRTDAADLLSQILFVKGFAVVPMNVDKALYSVVSLQGPARALVTTQALYMTPDEVRKSRGSAMCVLTGVALEHTAPQGLVNSLRPFLMHSGNMNSVIPGYGGGTHTLMLQGPAMQVANVLDLVATLDDPRNPPVPELQRLEERIAELEQSLRNQTAALERRIIDIERRGTQTEKGRQTGKGTPPGRR